MGLIASSIGLDTEKLSINDDVRRFIETNESKWNQFLSARSDELSGCVLVDNTLDSPAYYLPHNVLANYVACERDLEPVYLLGGFQNRRLRKIAASYGSDEFVYLNLRKLRPRLNLESYVDAKQIFGRLETGDDLLDVAYQGIRIGDLVYNTYLRRTGEGTIADIDEDVFSFLYDGILYKNFYDLVFEKYNIEAVVQTHLFYYKCGILGRTALSHGAEVYARELGPDQFAVKRYSDLEEARISPLRPPEDLVEHVDSHHRSQAMAGAEAYLNERLSGNSAAEVAREAYGDHTESMTRHLLYEKFKLDEGLPIGVIMPHVFTDAVHNYDRLLFRDYLTWLRETLDHLVNLPSVNWLVKPHPVAELYDCEQTVEGEVERVTRNESDHTVELIPSESNTRSLIELADVVVTARGTAGLEFPCFGVPSILAGTSKYSGFGFTIEPRSKRDYFRALEEVPQLDGLSEEQIQQAKVVAYVHFVLLPIETDIIPGDMPWMTPFDQDEKLNEAAALLRETDPSNDVCYRTIKRFLADDSFDHALNYDLIGL